MLQRSSHISIGHRAEMLLSQSPVTARQAPQVFEPRFGALLETLAVKAEVEEAIEYNAEQVERFSCRHFTPATRMERSTASRAHCDRTIT